MEIKEIKILKKELENKITKSILEFQEKSGVNVSKISFQDYAVYSNGIELKEVCLETII